MSAKVLIIDDDSEAVELLSAFLLRYGYEVHGVGTAVGGIELLRRLQPDLVILDVMLPEMTGLEFCTQLRLMSNVPVIMLSALGHVSERIVGLEVGADDYMGKPFEPRELLARMQTILRRRIGRGIDFNKMKFGNLEIDVRSRSVHDDGKRIDLSSTEFEAFLLLAKNPGRVISRDELLEHLRGKNCEVFSRTVDTLVSRMRTKLNDSAQDPRYIKTAWGDGYVFVAQANAP